MSVAFESVTQKEVGTTQPLLNLSSSDVLSRIEALVEALVGDLASGRVPPLHLATCRSRTTRPEGDGHGHQPGEEEITGISRSLLQSQGAAALSYARVLVVLNTLHNLLSQGRQATQRDLFYTLLQPPLFCSVRDVNSALADAAALVRVPRSRLGVSCVGRGAVAGRLGLRDGPGAPWVDCSTAGPSGRALPGDLAAIAALGLMLTTTTATTAIATTTTTIPNPAATASQPVAGGTRGGSGVGAAVGCVPTPLGGYLLVVEKDAVFQRLAEDRIWEQLPCVLLTARGVPDLATRAFASRLVAAFPGLQPLGLVDFNPAGVVILATYKYGSDRLGPEGRAHPLPGLRWLGLRSRQLAAVEERHLQPLTERDLALLRGLRGRLEGREPGWVTELAAMEAAGYKGDIEAVYRSGASVATSTASPEVGNYGQLQELVLRAVVSRDVV